MKYYTGVGSRNTPTEILAIMHRVAYHYALKGYTLRSGGAEGADAAFENGCRAAFNNSKDVLLEVFVPWRHFNTHRTDDSGIILVSEKDY